MALTRIDITSQGQQLATYSQGGANVPGIFYVGGHKSVIAGNSKVERLAEIAAKLDVPFSCFDYAGYGDSEGVKDGIWQLDTWLPNMLDAFDAMPHGPHILAGASMGGWLAASLAILRPDKVAGMFLMAPGFGTLYPTTGKTSFDLPETKSTIRMKIADDGRHQLIDKLDITCPIVCLHGRHDDMVSYKCSFDLCNQVRSDYAEVQIIPDATHRFSNPAELAVIEEEFGKFYQRIAPRPDPALDAPILANAVSELKS